jgi:DME family drug/metabolite transporter
VKQLKGKEPIVFVLLAAMLWGTTGTAQTFAPENTDPIAIGAIRLAVGGGSLLIIVLLIGQLNMRKLPVKGTVIASLSMAFYQPLFFSAVTITGVAIGTVIAIGSAPILSGLLEWFILKKRPTKIWWAATIVSFSGCFLLFINKESIHIDYFGILMALGAGLSFASYTLASKQLLKRHSPLAVVAIVFTLSAILLIPFLFIFDLSWLLEFRGITVSLHLGILATGLAYLLFSKGLLSISSSTAVTLSLAEPLTAALLGVFLVGEHLTLVSWAGIGLLFIGIALLTITLPPPKSAKGPTS